MKFLPTKLNNYIIIFFLLLHSAFLNAQYDYKREILGDLENWNSIQLPPDVLSVLQSDFDDLRIYGLNAAGDTLEVPYILRIAEQEIKQSKNPLSILNESIRDEVKYFTLMLEEESTINNLQLAFFNQNYDWKASLDGSNDGNEWFSILEDYRILSIHNNLTHYEFGTLNFTASKFHYFRLKIADFKTEEPKLEWAELSLKTVENAKYLNYPIGSTRISINEKSKESIIELNLRQNLPLSFVHIEVKESTDYFRPIRFEKMYDSIPSENGYKYLYSEIGHSTLSSLNSDGFELSPTFVKHLKISIQNDDNRALNLGDIAIKGYQYSLLARMTDVTSPFLLYGNRLAIAPKYDLKQFESAIPNDAHALLLGDEQVMEQDNKDDSSGLFENIIWLWTIIIALILILGFFTLKIMRDTASNQSEA